MPLATLQNGRYRILRTLGSGSMGEVYLVDDIRINRQVAIKVIRTESTPYPDIGTETIMDAPRLFEREAKAIARLNHPNILPLYDFGEEIVNGTPLAYMVMPYSPEGSLATWLQQRSASHQPNQLSPQEVAHFLRQAADALQHAHDNGIIHQDVKPQNFLIRSNKNASLPDLLLADFGIAKLAVATSGTSQAIRGTPLYMAPEQWEGHPVPASDQYSLAAMIYQLLTGQPPFQGGPGQLMYQHFNIAPQPPSTFNPAVPPQLDNVLLHALAKRPQDRFTSVSAFNNAFKQALLTAPVNPTALMSEEQTVADGLPVPGSQVRPSDRPLILPAPPTNPPVFTSTPGPSPRNDQITPDRSAFSLTPLLLIVLALLLIVGSAGAVFYYFATNNTNSSPNGGVTGTTQTNNNTATSQPDTNATATANAQTSVNATATANANAHATATSNANATATAQNNTNANATATAQANATATTQANATATATAHGIISQGTGTLHGNSSFDFDHGMETNTRADVLWHLYTNIVRTMDPINGATIVNLGIINFDSITFSQLQTANYSTTPLDGNNDPTNQLVNGDVFAVKSTDGNYAKILIVSYGSDLQIQWVTYHG